MGEEADQGGRVKGGEVGPVAGGDIAGFMAGVAWRCGGRRWRWEAAGFV